MARFRRWMARRTPTDPDTTYVERTPYPVQTRTFEQAPLRYHQRVVRVPPSRRARNDADHPRDLDPRGHGCIRPARCLLRLGGDGHASGVRTQASEADSTTRPAAPDSDHPRHLTRTALGQFLSEKLHLGRYGPEALSRLSRRARPAPDGRRPPAALRRAGAVRRGRAAAGLRPGAVAGLVLRAAYVIRHSTRSSSSRSTPPRTSSSGTTCCSGTSTPRPSRRSSPGPVHPVAEVPRSTRGKCRHEGIANVSIRTSRGTATTPV